MSDRVSITNLPDSGSPERVAYDLMMAVARNENQEKTRDYFLNLYSETIHVVRTGNRKAG